MSKNNKRFQSSDTASAQALAPVRQPEADEDLKRREDFYKLQVQQAWKDKQESADGFDRNLLTFSSTGLGASLVFIKDVVRLDHARHMGMLYSSWLGFVVCIVVTIFSFPFSQRAFTLHLRNLEKYYLESDEKSLNPPNLWTRCVQGCSWIGGIAFLFAVVTTVLFVYLNMKGI